MYNSFQSSPDKYKTKSQSQRMARFKEKLKEIKNYLANKIFLLSIMAIYLGIFLVEGYLVILLLVSFMALVRIIPKSVPKSMLKWGWNLLLSAIMFPIKLAKEGWLFLHTFLHTHILNTLPNFVKEYSFIVWQFLNQHFYVIVGLVILTILWIVISKMRRIDMLLSIIAQQAKTIELYTQRQEQIVRKMEQFEALLIEISVQCATSVSEIVSSEIQKDSNKDSDSKNKK